MSIPAFISSWWYGNSNATAAPVAAASDNNTSKESTTVGCKHEFSEKEDDEFMIVDHKIATDAKATAKASDILKSKDNAKENEDHKAKPNAGVVAGTDVVAVGTDVVVRRIYLKAPSKKSRDRQLAKVLFADADTGNQAKPSIPRSFRPQHATTRQHGHIKSPSMPIQQPTARKLIND